MRFLVNMATRVTSGLFSQQSRNLATKSSPGRFADPSFDTTFKMIFGQESNKPILVSLLNGLLSLDKTISVKDVEIQDTMLLPEYSGNLSAELDVKCKLSNEREILVEMQRVNKVYFLPRTQYYMAKSLSLQMAEGEGKQHHKQLLPTHMLVIGGTSIFTADNTKDQDFSFSNDHHFEKTIIPWIVEMGRPLPIHLNRMFWKFYELNKFANVAKQGELDPHDSKYQWLDFLHSCASKEEVPEDVLPEIRRAYEIMEKQQWNKEQREHYELMVRQVDTDEVDLYSMFEEEAIEREEKAKTEGAIEIAKKLLQNGVEESVVLRTTGLSAADLDNLDIRMGMSVNHSGPGNSNGSSSKREYHTFAGNMLKEYTTDIESLSFAEENVTSVSGMNNSPLENVPDFP